MRAILTVDMDGPAFEAPGMELASVLRDAADHVENWGGCGVAPLRDTNGNRVGELRIEDGPAQPTAERELAVRWQEEAQVLADVNGEMLETLEALWKACIRGGGPQFGGGGKDRDIPAQVRCAIKHARAEKAKR